MNNHPHHAFAASPAQGLASHPRSVTHQVTFHSAAAIAAQQQQDQQHLHLHHPNYLTHSATAQGVPPFVLATHVSVPVTVQPAPQSLHVAPGGSHPSIYKPQLSDLKRLCQLMLDASSASPINLTPFDALFLDAEGLMELASCMQLKIVELAKDMSNSEAISSALPSRGATIATGSDNAANASGSPKGSRSSSEAQRLRVELNASRAELQQALSVISNYKERERQFELLQQQHSRTARQLTDALSANEALTRQVGTLEGPNAARGAPHVAHQRNNVEKLSLASQRNEKLAKELQEAVRNFKAEMKNEKKQQGLLLDSLRRKHERALLCQMRASVRSLRTIQERNEKRKASNPADLPTRKLLRQVDDVPVKDLPTGKPPPRIDDRPVKSLPRFTTLSSAKELSHEAS
jgi:hypothetical protein